MYMMVTFLIVLSYYGLLKKDNRLWLLATVSALYTHYFSLLIFLSQLITNKLINYKKKGKKNQWQPASFAAAIIYLPWVIYLIIKKNFHTNFWIIKPSLTEIINFPAIIFSGYEKGWGHSYHFLTFFSLLFFFITYQLYRKRETILDKKIENNFYQLVSWFFFPFLFTLLITIFFKPLFIAKYLIFITPALLLLLIIYTLNLHKTTKFLFFCLLFFFTFYFNFTQIKNKQKANFAQFAHNIESLAKKEDSFYVISPLDFHLAQYYLGKKRVFIYNKNYSTIPDYIGKVLIPKNHLTNHLPIFPTKAFIIFPNLSYKIAARY